MYSIQLTRDFQFPEIAFIMQFVSKFQYWVNNLFVNEQP